MSFPEQLKKARLRSGYTQQEVADKMGITKSTYCGYETGKRQPDVEKIKQLASIFQTSGDMLLEIEIPAAASDSDDLSPLEHQIIKNFRTAVPAIQYACLRLLEIDAAEFSAEKEKRHA